MIKIIIMTVCLLFSLNAMANCPKPNITITTRTRNGVLVYKYVSEQELQKMGNNVLRKNKQIKNYKIRGLTKAKLDVKMHGKSKIFKKNKSYCAGLTDINFTIGYDRIDVYIDKKYKKNSCQHKTIKRHEDEHVAIFREAISFFKPDIQKALRKATKDLKYEESSSKQSLEKVTKKQLERVEMKIMPLLKHINKKLQEKQLLIDTPESYRSLSKRCNDW